MNKKGFTLIELLAVIVILAIIALIATPTILGVIEKAKKGAAEASALGYIDAIEKQIMINEMDTRATKLKNRAYSVEELNSLGITIKGTKPSNGVVVISKGNVIRYDLTFDNYIVTNGKAIKSSERKKYENGTAIYYNPTVGEKCTESESVSLTGTKSGCMKWYTFNDEEGNSSVNLILDHNTTARVAWNSSGNNSEMKEVATQLESDTKAWKNAARLITANEVAKISGNTSFDSSKTNQVWFCLDTNKSDKENICAKSKGTSKYKWLFDNTTNCTSYGCDNDSNIETYGYWTSSANVSESSHAWFVHRNGYLNFSAINNTYYGIRPVISVSKSIIK